MPEEIENAKAYNPGILGAGKVAIEKAAIESEVEALESTIVALHNALDELQVRLIPVSSDEKAVGSEPSDDQPLRGSSKMYYKLTELNDRTHAAIKRVHYLRRGLEV